VQWKRKPKPPDWNFLLTRSGTLARWGSGFPTLFGDSFHKNRNTYGPGLIPGLSMDMALHVLYGKMKQNALYDPSQP
jgi:hypothetical protein